MALALAPGVLKSIFGKAPLLMIRALENFGVAPRAITAKQHIKQNLNLIYPSSFCRLVIMRKNRLFA